STGSPLKSAWPRVGVSKPATMLSSVDLPQPDGPSSAANSFRSISTSIAWSASTRFPRLTNSFHTSTSWIVGRDITTPPRAAERGGGGEFGSGARLGAGPPEHPPPAQLKDAIGEKREQPHRDRGPHADVHAAHVVRAPQDIAEPRLPRDHPAPDPRCPRHAD